VQNKNKKNLYKILFITIMLGFIISLVGCSWLSLGLLNIFDPQAQIRLISMEYSDENKTMVNIEVGSLNQVEFVGSGFKFKYSDGNSRVESLDRTVGANFYITPSTEPGVVGDTTSIEDILLYSGSVMSYAKTNFAFDSLNCDIYLLGDDGAGYGQEIKIATGVPAMGIDNELPTASITTYPSPATGPPTLTVLFDASGSTDNRGIASYSWNFGEGNFGTGPIVSHTFSTIGTYAVRLTVTDYFGNEAYAFVSVKVIAAVGPDAVISASPTSGNPPLTVGFDASGSSANDECGCGNVIESYLWNFGDPDSSSNTSTAISVTHTYESAGTYVVILTVTDSNGDTGQDVQIITVGTGEVGAQITTTPSPATGTVSLTVAFEASGSTVETPPASYAWDLDGDGVFDDGAGIYITNTFATEGTYLVGLEVTDSDSPANVYYDFVTVTALPK